MPAPIADSHRSHHATFMRLWIVNPDFSINIWNKYVGFNVAQGPNDPTAGMSRVLNKVYRYVEIAAFDEHRQCSIDI